MMITIDRLNNRVTPVNSIRLPARFVELAVGWHSGIDCILYAVASCATILTGTDCPVTDYTDELDRQQKWYYLLWRELYDSIDSILCSIDDSHEDYDGLVEFRESVGGIFEVLEYEYGLEGLY